MAVRGIILGLSRFQPRQITAERDKAQLLLKNRPGDDRLWWFKK